MAIVKQKAAAEQAALEKAEREAQLKIKADKAKMQDERHKANLDALGNLQKLLVSFELLVNELELMLTGIYC